ncbi:hypothetical protein F442_07622 [Phytophthora nicotianae P10297]|uniref:HAT C-terminal dimerisation domain-containing protein n=1 Tax=Phytophthora nicotianae P10297 TaxID=1317064 RepID=W2ZG85_PHYNI|nr:hypothetical protein F442_07622 [Phytophthora nicotianae P10297]
MFVVGDNCAVNKRLAHLMGVPLVGCASHRLNLAVRRFLKPYEEDLEQVQTLMRRLRTITQASKLRLKTSLRPKLRNETRWGSTFAMLDRYLVLREYISADDDELAEVMPSPAANRRLKALLVEMADVESISKKLQSIDLNLLDARDLLNGLLEIKPSLSHYLAPNSDIVHSPDFELGVVKVLGGQAKRLSRAERSALQSFLRRSTTATCEEEEAAKLGFADRILKRRKVEAEPSAYILLHAIPPTSNIV